MLTVQKMDRFFYLSIQKIHQKEYDIRYKNSEDEITLLVNWGYVFYEYIFICKTISHSNRSCTKLNAYRIGC